MRTFLMLGTLCLLIFLALPAVHPAGAQQRLHPNTGDDEPIIIADSTTVPLENEARKKALAAIKTPPYRYIYNAYLKVDPKGKADEISDANHKVTVLYVCNKDISGKYFAVKELDLSAKNAGEIHVWNGGLSARVKLKWSDRSKIGIVRGGHAGMSAIYPNTALDLDYPIREARWESEANDKDFKRSSTDNSDFRIVIHYCTSNANCTPAYLRDHDPCASSLPPTLALAAKP